MKNRRRFELLLFVALLSSLALIAGLDSEPEPVRSVPAQPRVAIDGVALGDDIGTVSIQWGDLDMGSYYEGSRHVRPVSELGTPAGPFGSREAKVGVLGGAEFVGGRCLTINGRKALEVGDSLEKVKLVLGEPKRGLIRYKYYCSSNRSPLARQSFMKHGVVVSLLVPNEKSDQARDHADWRSPRVQKVWGIDLRYPSRADDS